MEEFVKCTFLLRPHFELFEGRFSERGKEVAAVL